MPTRPSVHRPSRPLSPVVRYSEREAIASRQARRQFATNSATWRKIRHAQLCQEPLCRECAKRNKHTAASCVDHIDGDAFNNDPINLQSLCSPCHSRKTNRENGGYGNPKRKQG